MKLSVLLFLLAPVFIIFALCVPAASMDDPGFTIRRMVICEKIADREPVAIADTYSADTEEVFCFLEAGSIEKDTTVTFVWYHEGTETARVSLPLRKGDRWRTYASKKIGGRKGEWNVELQESTGIVLNSVTFQVQ